MAALLPRGKKGWGQLRGHLQMEVDVWLCSTMLSWQSFRVEDLGVCVWGVQRQSGSTVMQNLECENCKRCSYSPLVELENLLDRSAESRRKLSKGQSDPAQTLTARPAQTPPFSPQQRLPAPASSWADSDSSLLHQLVCPVCRPVTGMPYRGSSFPSVEHAPPNMDCVHRR